MNVDVTRRCPFCGKMYTRPPALSRTDNKTEICPLCGVREALLSASMPEKKTQELIKQLEEITHGS